MSDLDAMSEDELERAYFEQVVRDAWERVQEHRAARAITADRAKATGSAS